MGGGKLAFPSVDTGMGLERLSSVVERVPSNFDTRAFAPLLEKVAARLNWSEREREERIFLIVFASFSSVSDVACRVVADHARAAVFLAADGVLPVGAFVLVRCR